MRGGGLCVGWVAFWTAWRGGVIRLSGCGGVGSMSGVELSEPYCWCVVANVAKLTAHGDGGRDVESGLKHFSPGTKLWIPMPRWAGVGPERTAAIGRHRGSSRCVSVVVALRHLADFRVRAVYSAAVFHAIEDEQLWESRGLAETMAVYWNRTARS